MLNLTFHKAGKNFRSAVTEMKGNSSEMSKSRVRLLHAHNQYLQQQSIVAYRGDSVNFSRYWIMPARNSREGVTIRNA
jgi:hypothetical protein